MSIKNLITYHPNGQKKSEGDWDGYEPVGDHRSWHENGNKESEVIELGDSIQSSTHWYENGQKKSTGLISQIHYLETGLWTYWYDNGNKQSEGHHKAEDGRDGEWRFWNSSGQLICCGIHKGWCGDGLWEFWDNDGNKVHERKYTDLELLDVWKNLREDGCSDDLVTTYKSHIFNENLL